MRAPRPAGRDLSDRSGIFAQPSSAASVRHASSIDNQEHVADIMRLRMVMSCALVLWLVTGVLDWSVVRFVQPGPLAYFLWLRGGSWLILCAVLARLFVRPAPGAVAFRALEVLAFSTAALTASLLCLRYRGIASPYAHSLSCILAVRGISLPSHYRKGLLAAFVPASLFPLTMGVAARFLPAIQAQFHDPAQLAIFVQSVSLILVTSVVTVLGGHTMWALRRQVFAARNIGRYRLQHRIGRGGMGEVWQAHHPSLRRAVAIKLLRGAESNPNALSRFEREVRATSELKHPNTIRVFDFGVTEDGLWYYAMELLEGETLASLIDREGPLPPARALRLIRQACRAMAEAHGRNIIHRDIKPDNLFLTSLGGETDFIKVLDFGIVKLMDEELRHSGHVTGEGSLLGTPAYMSPEQFEGQVIDARTDVFSIGAVLYYLLTAEPPYRGTTLAAIRAAHWKPVEPPAALTPQPITPELERVVLRCLECEPARRYPSAAELDEELAAVEKTLPALPPEPASASAQPSMATDEHPVTEPPADQSGIFKKPVIE